MPRNSEIDREGLGAQVLTLASKDGATAPRIAATISDSSGKEFSAAMVHRYIQKDKMVRAMATTNVPTMGDPIVRMLVAAITGTPDESRDSATTSSYFGLYKLNAANVFTGYYGIARGIKNGQVMRGFKNISLKITAGARIVGDENDVEKIDALMTSINFSSLLQNVVRSTCEMGTSIVLLKSKDGEAIIPQITPMPYITLLTDNETPGTVEDTLVHGTVTQIIHGEGGKGEIRYTLDDVGLFRIWEDGNEFVDIKGRNTFGIYGESMTIGVENPLKSLMNATFYWDAFLARYGSGRLLHNFTLLADMIREKTITTAAAQQTIDNDAAAGQKIGANEDIYGTGKDVSMLESKTGFDIVPYLEWRAMQIDRALLQSDVGAGDVGSSWTSAGTAVSAQELVALQSLRDTIFRMFMDKIIVPRLDGSEFNIDPKTISITAEPLSQVPVPYQVLTDWVDRDMISESEARVRGGFSSNKPEDM